MQRPCLGNGLPKLKEWQVAGMPGAECKRGVMVRAEIRGAAAAQVGFVGPCWPRQDLIQPSQQPDKGAALICFVFRAKKPRLRNIKYNELKITQQPSCKAKFLSGTVFPSFHTWPLYHAASPPPGI